MTRWKRVVVTSLILFLCTAAMASEASAKTFPPTVIQDVMKSWTIKFRQQVDTSSVTEATIYIVESGQKHAASVELLADGKTVKVTPRIPYEVGKRYQLEISNKIRSTKNKKMSANTTMPFQLADSSSAIQTIFYSAGEGLHHFKITATYEVHSVKINGVSLRMTGLNEFSHTFTSLKAGSTVTIRAYGETGKTLETKTYTLD